MPIGTEGKSFSYSGDPTSSLKDAVRFEIADTDPQAPLLTDEEVQFCIEEETTAASSVTPTRAEMLSAAARAMEVLARLFSMQANTQVGSLHTEYTKQAENYDRMAKELRRRAAGQHVPWWGGRSESQKEALHSQTDRVQEVFARDQFTNPWRSGPFGPGGPVRPS